MPFMKYHVTPVTVQVLKRDMIHIQVEMSVKGVRVAAVGDIIHARDVQQDTIHAENAGEEDKWSVRNAMVLVK
jgi:hypothetical protein